MSQSHFRYHNQPITQQLIADIAGLLDAHNIPGVLWGNSMLIVHGVPSFTEDISFIVPDQAVPTATSTLRQAGFKCCTLGHKCRFAYDTVEFITSPPPSAHFHMTGHNVVKLFEKSETLSTVANFSASPNAAPSAQIILASDLNHLPRYEPDLGEGAFPQDLHPVRVPSAHCLVETYSTLMLRDWTNDYGTFWMSMLAYIMTYVAGKGKLDLQQVEPQRRKFFVDMRAGKIGTAQAVKNLRQALEAGPISTLAHTKAEPKAQ
ncbi:hypothetical protein GJ744_001401 [Endocarpon pusillum]|uniref:Nucleotidyltransferase family protein n=1 Tax=Endocarpon pusillum TaxID=364733 RepID=A0A8H7ASZ8_9EURO|nr:hypothetical protein GJ744_001401 [Endocarpon pusillum]